MKKNYITLIWMIALALILLCVLFPERRQTFTGGALPRKFLFSSELYARPNPTAGLLVEIDFSRTILKCILIGTIAGLATLGSSIKHES